MTLLDRRRTWRPLALPIALCAAYLLTRLVNLGSLPMVSDEGTYITWGVRALYGSGVEEWLASLEDGKQPLLAWLMPPFLALFEDRLIAGRLVSVLTGLASLTLLVVLGRRLFGHAAGWLSGALYVLAPIALVHDRMALYDSLVTTTALLVLLAALRWAECPSAGRTAQLGACIGLALLTKLSALFFVGLVPLVIAAWRLRSLANWWRLSQAFFIAAACYSVLYLSPIVDNLQEGNFQRYSLTAGEALRFPFDLWLANATFVTLAAGTYLGPALALACVAGLFLAALRTGHTGHAGRGGLILLLWVAVPLAAFVLTAKIIYSRYIVFCFVCALPAAAYLLVEAWRLSGRVSGVLPLLGARRGARGLAAAAGVALVAWPAAAFGAALLADPRSAPWMNDRRWITDRFQYVESNYAGYGLREIVDYLGEQAQRKPVVVLTRDATGMPRDGVTAYLLEQPSVTLGFVPEREPVAERLERQATRAFLLANQGADLYYVLTDAPNGEQEQLFRRRNPEMRLVLDIPKPGNHSRFQLYQMPWDRTTDDIWLDPAPRFGGTIVLRGYNLSARATHPSGTLRLILYWEATARPPRDYNVFNHVADAGGAIRGQKDGPPGGGQLPTSRWRPRQLVADTHEVQIRPDAPPGDYVLNTGLYDLQTLQRLPVTLPGGAPADHVNLGRVSVFPGS